VEYASASSGCGPVGSTTRLTVRLVKDVGLGGRFLLFVVVLQRQQERIVGIPPEGEGVGTAGEAAVLGDEPVVAAVQATSQVASALSLTSSS
jgi:hypothetical protein